MPPQRITLLREPPIVGKRYLVPVVTFPWHDRVRDWPVFLPRHEDAAHLNFVHQHHHIDPRFVRGWDWHFAKKYHWPYPYEDRPLTDKDAFGALQVAPLNRTDMVLPPVWWKELICARAEIPYQFSKQISEKLTPHFLGRQCRSSKAGWICPHKRVPLGSFAPVDGVVTCPLHGLQITHATGKVVGPTSPAGTNP